MKETIHIESSFESWKFDIILPNALPSFSIGDFKKLLKYIDEDFDHRDEIRKDLKEFLSESLDIIPDQMQIEAKMFSDYEQKISDGKKRLDEINYQIKNKRTSTFMPISKDQIEKLKDEKVDLRNDLMTWREFRNDAKRNLKDMERCQKKYEKEMEVLKEWKQ